MRQHGNWPLANPYFEFSPPAELRPYLDACWFFQPAYTQPTQDILIPEGVVDIVFNFGEPYYRQPVSEAKTTGQWIDGDVVVGQRTTLFTVEWPVEARLFSVRIKAEAAHLLLPIPMCDITNEVVPLCEVGLGSLGDRLRELPYEDHAAITDRCFHFLSALLSSVDKPDERLGRVIEAIRERKGDIDIQRMCDQLEINRRTVERLFARKVGISPKLLARTERLHHFLCLHHEKSGRKLAHSALDAQYYDQSHFVREFRKFTGESPRSFFKSPPEIYGPLLASLQGRRASG